MHPRLRRLGFSFVVLVAVAGLLELGCRLGPWQASTTSVYRTGFTGCWFREAEGTVTLCEEDTGRFGPQTFPAEVGEACRVMFLGGSSVRLPGHRGWPERATLGAVPVEVVNLGVPGATSLATTLRGQDALRYHPDVLVVYEGHNDLAQWSFGAPDEVVQRDQRIARWVLWAQGSALVRTTTWLLQGVTSTGKREAAEGLRVAAAVVRVDQQPAIAAELRENFTALVRAAGEVPVIQVVPISNSGKSPLATVVDVDLERGRLVDERVLLAFRLLEAGDAAAALAGADLALAEDRTHAGAWWVRARALQAAGRGPEAVEAYGQARRYDAIPLRSTPEIDDAVRAVPAAEVVDLPALLAEAGGLVPDALFSDMVHFSAAGHDALARVLSERIQPRCAERLAARRR